MTTDNLQNIAIFILAVWVSVLMRKVFGGKQ